MHVAQTMADESFVNFLVDCSAVLVVFVACSWHSESYLGLDKVEGRLELVENDCSFVVTSSDRVSDTSMDLPEAINGATKADDFQFRRHLTYSVLYLRHVHTEQLPDFWYNVTENAPPRKTLISQLDHPNTQVSPWECLQSLVEVVF